MSVMMLLLHSLDYFVLFYVFFFFFKQKTAYEMRISDWSSDVCSSDLHLVGKARAHRRRRGGCARDLSGIGGGGGRPDRGLSRREGKDAYGGASDGALLAGVAGAGGAWRAHHQRHKRERGR